MKEKQKSLIEKIIINDATFHEEVIEPTYAFLRISSFKALKLRECCC